MKTSPMLYFLTLLTLGGLFSSCERRPLEEYTGCWVHVRINWAEAYLDPNGASVYFFPKQGGTPYILWTNYTADSIYLPAGNYSALVFNERTSEYTDIAFRGTQSYETFEVYALPEHALPEFLQYQ
ncbi:MAG: DUF5119 domain-containing protein, partial [Tannerellaceae bacterium]|nr:DUF5119 domain-containing protein [Tannerellaceae bacterium]